MIKRKAIAAIMAGLLAMAPGLAACSNNAASTSAASESTSSAQESTATETASTAQESASSDTPEWAVVDEEAEDQDTTAQAELPAQYDMREKGLVTPVKRQNPWGACWSFGVIAASESSILSAMGSTYEDTKLDLSEKHLAYFGLSPITEGEDPAQAGEGVYMMDESIRGNDIYDAGGHPMYATALFAMGVGPINESAFPYRGTEEITAYDYVTTQDKETVIRDYLVPNFKVFTGETVDEYIASHDDVSTAEEAYDALYNARVERYKDLNEYYMGDDWTIPERREGGLYNRWLSSGAVLKDGNKLPDIRTAEGQAAAKREMLAGRAVAVAHQSDNALPEQGEGKYINLDTWALFCGKEDEDLEHTADHEVCIVGWDDNYPKENFKEGLRPDVDGAWLVKNSWGSETDAAPDDLGNVVNRQPWGIVDENGKHTGYFWLSYQDVSITNAETFGFSVGDGTNGGIVAMQYDYLPDDEMNINYPQEPSEDVVSSANVFEAECDCIVKSVSTYAPNPDTRVTFAIYRLGADASDPTDGELLFRTTKDFELVGYHRVDVDKEMEFKKGERLAVVTTASYVDEDGKRVFIAPVSAGMNKFAIDQFVGTMFEQSKYVVTVVNRGESYFYENGAWKDWVDVLADKDAKEKESGSVLAGQYSYDNFSIKAFAEPTE
ncbi:MAG: hypothetical protein J6S63_08885 [Atopobiaceae bacterium]|nr:hypothetical protein [Atopobiaceae bacterium]